MTIVAGDIAEALDGAWRAFQQASRGGVRDWDMTSASAEVLPEGFPRSRATAGFYVVLTRGTHANPAYVFTQSSKRADPAPGPRPAPELARYDRLRARAAGPGPTSPAAGTEAAMGVLAEVIGRNGQLLSASQAWQQALADADHLAVLHGTEGTAHQTTDLAARHREFAATLSATGERLYRKERTCRLCAGRLLHLAGTDLHADQPVTGKPAECCRHSQRLTRPLAYP